MTREDLDIERAIRELAPRPDPEPDWEAMVADIMAEVRGRPAFAERPVVVAGLLAAAAIAIAALSSSVEHLSLSAEPATGVELVRTPAVSTLDERELASLDRQLVDALTAELAVAASDPVALGWVEATGSDGWADALAAIDSLDAAELDRLAASLEQ